MKMVFRIRLKPLHDASGKTKQRVSHDLHIPHQTIMKYVNPEYVETTLIATTVAKMAAYYGASLSDVIEVVEIEGEA